MFTLSIYQIILVLISLIFIVSGTSKFLKQEKSQTFFKFSVTLIIWGSIFIFSLVPSASYAFAKMLGLGSNLNTLIFIGFVILFIIVFKLLNIIERLEQNISEIVRKEALEKLKMK